MTIKCGNCGHPMEVEETKIDYCGNLCPFCSGMKNLAMARKVRRGEAVDLRNNKRTEEGEYLLDEFIDGVDYCDTKEEVWIWSIGVNGYGEIRAATDNRFYQSERNGWKCLFLR